MCVQIPYIPCNVFTMFERRKIMAVATKEKRVIIRISNEAKKTIEEAAKLSNISLSSYILSVVLKQAMLDLEQNEMITLNSKEKDKLMNALSNPPLPNDALKDLLA